MLGRVKVDALTHAGCRGEQRRDCIRLNWQSAAVELSCMCVKDSAVEAQVDCPSQSHSVQPETSSSCCLLSTTPMPV